jgi:hypothetical protein
MALCARLQKIISGMQLVAKWQQASVAAKANAADVQVLAAVDMMTRQCQDWCVFQFEIGCDIAARSLVAV